MYTYYRLAMREEKDLEKQFGEEFHRYREQVPAFFPKWGGGKEKQDATKS